MLDTRPLLRSVHKGVQLADFGSRREPDDLSFISYPRPPQIPVPAAAKVAVQGLARAVAEVLIGARSPQQLARWLTADGSQRLAAWLASAQLHTARVANNRLVMHDRDRVEAVMTFDCDRTMVVAAARLDAKGQSWFCHDLEVLLPGLTGTATTRWDCARDRS